MNRAELLAQAAGELAAKSRDGGPHRARGEGGRYYRIRICHPGIVKVYDRRTSKLLEQSKPGAPTVLDDDITPSPHAPGHAPLLALAEPVVILNWRETMTTFTSTDGRRYGAVFRFPGVVIVTNIQADREVVRSLPGMPSTVDEAAVPTAP